MDIGDRIRRARTNANLSQTDLAARLQVSRGLVGQWESHKKKPGRENLRKIAEVTATDIAYLHGHSNKSAGSLHLDDPEEVRLVLYYRALEKRQRKNLLELIRIAGDVRRNIEHQSQPVD